MLTHLATMLSCVYRVARHATCIMEELSAVSSRDPWRPPRSSRRSGEPNPTESDVPAHGDATDDTGSTPSTSEQISRLRQSMQRNAERQAEPPRDAPPRATESFSYPPNRSAQRSAEPRQGSPPPAQRPAPPPSSLRNRSGPHDEPHAVAPDEPEYALRQPTGPRTPTEDDFDTYRYDDDFDDETFDDEPRRQRPARRSLPSVRIPDVRMSRPSIPPAIAQAAIVNDQVSLIIIGVKVLSLGLMAVYVANQIDTLPEVIATHVSASGVLENFASRSAIWQVPLLAGMLSLMNVAAAWFIASIDMFASRFLLAASLLVQFIAWVALFRILW